MQTHILSKPNFFTASDEKVWAMDLEQEYLESKVKYPLTQASREDAEEKAKRRLAANALLFSGRPKRNPFSGYKI